MNRIILLGRLTRDPEVRYTQNGKVVTQFTLAVDRPFINQEGQKEADFIPVVIWGKQAETIGNNISKGQRVLVEGRLQIRSYDAKDGSKRYVTEVIADRFEFIEHKSESALAAANNVSNQPFGPGSPSYNIPVQTKADKGFESFGQPMPAPLPFDEEIPF